MHCPVLTVNYSFYSEVRRRDVVGRDAGVIAAILQRHFAEHNSGAELVQRRDRHAIISAGHQRLAILEPIDGDRRVAFDHRTQCLRARTFFDEARKCKRFYHRRTWSSRGRVYEI